MKLEHVAINVAEPQAMAEWYEKHLGLRTVKQASEEPYMTFMADSSGRVMIEIYHNSSAQVPDYHSMNPLMLHFAFVSETPGDDKARLIAAGASQVSDEQMPDGSRIIMLRDPWGVPLQLCKRASPLLADAEYPPED